MKIWISAFMVLLLAGCTVKPATDFDATQDFSQYRSFDFLPFPEGQPKGLDDRRLENALGQQLQLNGLTRDEQAPDLLVAYRIDEAFILEEQGGASVSYGVGFGSRRSGVGMVMSSPVRLQERRYGKLVVELIDPGAESVVWSSISQSQLRETMKPEAREQFIQRQLELMFEAFPPQ
ncbi:DUF4136 domain-containing protein [Aliagarivorans taiwanensis]|uniref:DUF4136 domain-containing protein n=1 Tax=Aliagarivorans taiwanensis TaxID=561966 RepID=UPI0004153D6C|nr:DUF4136 domain-containing protein [Aliagarivorans taiwanensis]